MEWHLLGILTFVVIYNIYWYYKEDDHDEYCLPIATPPNDNQVAETNIEEKIERRVRLRCILFQECSWNNS